MEIIDYRNPECTILSIEYSQFPVYLGYIDWITQAEELAELEAEDQQNAIKVTRRDDEG